MKGLHENYDYTFATQEDLPKALTLVDLNTIQQWEYQMI
jgi:hypothetical protein